ncbi:Uma2 family endonuclease [Thermobrachium celere]|uniref:Putative restriction endonuclease domain-containing protein n=1 Tax=Thermobrachium celere DSM 8682 TaxID=941824 RepID=R7RMP2_9CLOT|nr:Uma2 family endonuclease [Thermobrachium celere]CDF57447.1 hypothetical protein TCEL_01361 [Thermobrachium celere DSM 8682]
MGVAVNISKTYTYKDYKELKDTLLEIIDGVPYLMSPSPTVEHQRILRKLLLILSDYFKNGICEVFSVPLDVIFKNEEETIDEAKNVVQPDIFVVCDNKKINDKNIIGAPDLIIEIVSSSSQSLDYVKKLNLYEKYKVKEYLIVNPINKTILQYVYENDSYASSNIYTKEDIVKIIYFEGLLIDFKKVF